MSVRAKLFVAMAVLIVFMGLAYLGSTQGYLRDALPHLISAIEKERTDIPSLSQSLRLEQQLYHHMIDVAFKVVAVLSLIAIVIGYWVSRLQMNQPLLSRY